MNVYLLESVVHGPAIIEALNQQEATTEYLNNAGYDSIADLVKDVGEQYGLINAEIISENYYQFTRNTH